MTCTQEGVLAEFEPVASRQYPFALRLAAEPVLLAPAEWCGAMWRAAAVSILRLLSRLAARHLTLESVRPEFMTLARGCRPVYFRASSIIPADPGAVMLVCRQLADFFLLPLYLCATGRSAALRDLLDRGNALAPSHAFPELAAAALLACRSCHGGEPGEYAALAEQTAALRLPVADTFWSRYYPAHLSPERREPWPYKVHAVDRILDTMAPTTMVDLAANAGLYARLAVSKGIGVIAVDSDETCVGRLFDSASEGKLAITPAVGDICAPLVIGAPLERQRLSAQQRFGSELVLALAISHHLVFSPPWLGFADVADLFSSFSRRYLLTEFVGLEPEAMNPYRAEDRPGCATWFTLPNFMDALRRRFKDVVLVPGPVGRRLVLAEK